VRRRNKASGSTSGLRLLTLAATNERLPLNPTT
jgi:hypothetical protein